MTKKDKQRYQERMKINKELIEILDDALVDVNYIVMELIHYGCFNDVREKIFDNIRDDIWKVSERLRDENFDYSMELFEEGLNE